MTSKLKLKCLLTLTHKYITKQVIKTHYSARTILELADEIEIPVNPFNLDMVTYNCANHQCFKVYELIDNDTNVKPYFNVVSNASTRMIQEFRMFVYRHYHCNLDEYITETNDNYIKVSSNDSIKVVFNGYYLSFSKLKKLIKDFIVYYPNAIEYITLEDETKPRITDRIIEDKVRPYTIIEVLPPETITFGKYKHSLVSDIDECEELEYKDRQIYQIDSLMVLNLKNNIVDFKDIIVLLETINETCVLTVQQSQLISEIERYYCEHGTFNGFRYLLSDLADILLTILAY